MRKKAEGNNRVVIDQDGVTEQVNHYYPYGGIFGEGVASSVQPYKFGGKELDRMNGLDWSDFGARMLDSSSGLWGSIDPMAEKYYATSPYAYCVGNPILYVDPNGEDYIMYIDVENNRITISATYYSSTKDKESAQQAVDFWNNQSGTYKWGDFNVDFSLTVSEVETTENMTEREITGALNVALSNDNSGGGNVYKIVSDNKLGDNTNGSTDGNFIQVRNSRSNSDTGAHEVGHTLGLAHSSFGLMTPSSTDMNRTKRITRGGINDIINYPLKGKINSEGRAKTGKGNLKYFRPAFSTDKFISPYQK